MPISRSYVCTCKKCGRRFFMSLGDCVTLGDLAAVCHPLCDSCRVGNEHNGMKKAKHFGMRL